VPRSSSTLTAWLLAIWRSLDPAAGVVEPEVSPLDEWRTQFTWRGAPLTFDRRTKLVLRGGRTLAGFADIKSVDILHIRGDDDRREHWKVSLGTHIHERHHRNDPR
jgi:hypothetical protein